MSTSCSNTFPSMVTEPNCVSSILGSMLPSPPSPPRGGMYLHSACDAQRGARAAELCGHPGRGPRPAPDGAVPTYTLQASGRTAPTGRSGGRGDADGDQDYWCSGVKILLLLQHPHPAGAAGATPPAHYWSAVGAAAVVKFALANPVAPRLLGGEILAEELGPRLRSATRPRPGRRGARRSSQLDQVGARCRRTMLAFCSVVSVLVRLREIDQRWRISRPVRPAAAGAQHANSRSWRRATDPGVLSDA